MKTTMYTLLPLLSLNVFCMQQLQRVKQYRLNDTTTIKNHQRTFCNNSTCNYEILETRKDISKDIRGIRVTRFTDTSIPKNIFNKSFLCTSTKQPSLEKNKHLELIFNVYKESKDKENIDIKPLITDLSQQQLTDLITLSQEQQTIIGSKYRRIELHIKGLSELVVGGTIICTSVPVFFVGLVLTSEIASQSTLSGMFWIPGMALTYGATTAVMMLGGWRGAKGFLHYDKILNTQEDIAIYKTIHKILEEHSKKSEQK